MTSPTEIEPNVTVILPGGVTIICKPSQVGEVTRQATQVPTPWTPMIISTSGTVVY